jgi:hypothetical protein
MYKYKGVEGIHVDGDNMLPGEDYNWRLNSKIKTYPTDMVEQKKFFSHAGQKLG